ncbi:MAG: CHAD domain-containing protein [Thermoleophilaceae bacterium]
MKARKVKELEPEGALGANAGRIGAVRLEELRSFAPRALDPAEVEALHDMRIAAKRLRYVLEITEPALGPSARQGAKTAKRLQDLLGEIHDCDVMLPRVRAHTDRLRAEDAEWVGHAAGSRAKDLVPSLARCAPNLARYRGLEALGVYLSARRAVLFERFLREWEALESGGFAARLMEGLNPDPHRPASDIGGSGLSPSQPGPAAPAGGEGP